MKIEYTKQGMKITHPTGVVQILSVEDLTRQKERRGQRQAENETAITHLNEHIAETQKAQ